jgi:hypothetical protein
MGLSEGVGTVEYAGKLAKEGGKKKWKGFTLSANCIQTCVDHNPTHPANVFFFSQGLSNPLAVVKVNKVERCGVKRVLG